MKQRNRLLSVAVGAAMVVGSIVAFSAPTNAAAPAGNLTFAAGSTISIGSPAIVTTLTGGVVGRDAAEPSLSPATGTWTATGGITATGIAPPNFANCISVSIQSADTITWNAANTGTQTLTNAAITINSTGCPAPPQGVCVLTLNGARVLRTAHAPATGGFAYTAGTPTTRSGTFTAASGTTVGSYTLANGAGANCASSGLAAQIHTALGNPASTTTGTFSSTQQFSASITKTIQK